MFAIGERLRGERLKRGLSIHEVAEKTKISSRYLEAIEAGEPGDLPGEFFYRSFVRQYANLLNIEVGELEPELETPAPAFAGYGERSYDPRHDHLPVDPLPSPSGGSDSFNRLPLSIALLVAVLIGCAGLYSLWLKGWRSPEEPSAAVATSNSNASQPEASAPTRPASSAGAGAAAPVPAPDGKLAVDLSATEPVWVSVSSTGQDLFIGTLEAGGTKSVAGDGPVKIVVGNAGGIEVKINGRSLGPIGPRGQVRIINATADSHQITPPGGVKPAEPSPSPAPASPASENTAT
ncbi:MAG: DUF4115 domain-containing protein, partial [Bryobacteraceae bacterium]|nr:DUF4115 domain-containing protein [Bryobacteraceae bacterium]